jgi:WD40 repeat protein
VASICDCFAIAACFSSGCAISVHNGKTLSHYSLRVLNKYTHFYHCCCYYVCCYHGNRFIISGSKDSTVVMWDAAKRKRTLVLGGFLNSVIGVGASPTDSLFATGGGDNVVCIWKYNAGSATGATASASDIKDEVCTCNCRICNRCTCNCSTWCMFCHLGRACCYSKIHGYVIDSNQCSVGIAHCMLRACETATHSIERAYADAPCITRFCADSMSSYYALWCLLSCVITAGQCTLEWPYRQCP